METLLPFNSLNIPSILGTDHLLFFIMAFNIRKSKKNLGLPSFLVAKALRVVHADSSCAAIPAYSIRSTSFFTILLQSAGKHLNFCERGSSDIDLNLNLNLNFDCVMSSKERDITSG